MVHLCRSTHDDGTSMEPHETLHGRLVTHLQLHLEQCSIKTVKISLTGMTLGIAAFYPSDTEQIRRRARRRTREGGRMERGGDLPRCQDENGTGVRMGRACDDRSGIGDGGKEKSSVKFPVEVGRSVNTMSRENTISREFLSLKYATLQVRP